MMSKKYLVFFVVSLILSLLLITFLLHRKNHFISLGSSWGNIYLTKLGYYLGGDPNYDVDGTPILCIACANSGNMEVVRFLVDKHANINHTNKYGNTPLMRATWSGNTNVVDFLLKNGANINVKNAWGDTAMDIAVRKKRMKILSLLKKDNHE